MDITTTRSREKINPWDIYNSYRRRRFALCVRPAEVFTVENSPVYAHFEPQVIPVPRYICGTCAYIVYGIYDI